MSLYAVKNDEGVWLSLDSSHESVWYTNNPTLFKDRIYAEAQIIGRKAHVVELVEAPAKVLVSEEEAKMLEEANKNGYPAEVIDAYNDMRPDEDRLIRAYVNGYTVAKKKKYNVKVPHSRFYYWKWKDDEIGVGSGEDDDVRGVEPYRFTAAEIEHYGLQDCEKEEVTDDDIR